MSTGFHGKSAMFGHAVTGIIFGRGSVILVAEEGGQHTSSVSIHADCLNDLRALIDRAIEVRDVCRSNPPGATP